ncbi:unnamed protein product [Mytilus edulis]|uniref:Endonuclease/exonuclease/phosphatase domain-containing protein n=1 Tax=Mytilus edulis TaxID=6550 RepID=A0A8S3SKK5_MYTED|nr:unnamed protein product [Mytilus edulis]
MADQVAQPTEASNTTLQIVSFNCKSIKSCSATVRDLIRQNDFVLIQEHWLFEGQLNLIGEIDANVNYAAKGVDKYDPLPPIYLPRGYGGVAIIWKMNLDSIIKTLDDGRERIQCVEVLGKDNNNLILISIYLPSTGSRDHYEEFKDTIDQLNEIVLKYQDTHYIIIGGDLNEDLGNIDRINKRKDYLEKFVKETGLKYDNEGKTFVKVNGEECSELDYFLHKLGKIKPTHKQVLNSVMNNTSDHHPIKMKILYGISNDADCKNLTKDCTNRAVKWDKVDIDLYVAITNEQSDSILNMPLETLEQATSVLEQVHGFLNDAAATCAANKPRYNAKPKLNVWSPDIKLALDEMRKYYAQWVKQGKIKDPENNIYQQRLRTKKEFRRQVRIENAKVKDTEKQRIMETRTKDTKLFHQLVKINRKNRGNAIMDLHVGDICMSGEQNVMEGFKQHFRNLATPEESTVLENRQYHQQVEYEIGLITEMVKDKNIPPATLEELQKAIKSINKGKSADIYGITVEHILHAGKNLEMLLLNLINIIFKEGKVPDMLKEGLLTPVFKNKGEKNMATNYRGITVLPVLNKVIETIVKLRINPAVLITQNVTQRGFTAGSGPANAALPVEEIYREAKDNNQEYELVLLDAKSAFDVVIHSHLMKRLYHAGIDDKHWTIIQTKKSVAINIKPKPTKKETLLEEYTLNEAIMPRVDSAMHLGIIRTNSMKQNIIANIEENIKKSRRSAYALLGSGFHGENGLDMETIIHLFKIYILPVLLYGMDLLTPQSLDLEKLEKFQKKMLKQLMSLPTNTPDPAINILTGILPVEAQIHLKVMTLFINVCTQPNESLEKQLARRQLCIKSMNSNSWFIEVKTIMLKYDLGNASEWLDIQMKKDELLNKAKKGISAYWIERITSLAKLYTGLRYLNSDIFMPGKIHPILRIKHQSPRDSKRVPTKIKLLTGTYILQPLRYKIYKEGTEDHCIACECKEETLEHLLIECEAWNYLRDPILQTIKNLLTTNGNVRVEDLTCEMTIQVLMDITKIQKRYTESHLT